MNHLFNSVVMAEQMELTNTDSVRTTDWVPATGPTQDETDALAWIECRLDLQFLRPGDIPRPQEAGAAQNRQGLLFTGPQYLGLLKAGMRVVTINNAYGDQPVQGTFEIRVVPDAALDYTGKHHLEVQIIETVQEYLDGEWPGSDGDYDDDQPEAPDPDQPDEGVFTP